jgi:hypothetical protein
MENLLILLTWVMKSKFSLAYLFNQPVFSDDQGSYDGSDIEEQEEE